MKLKKLIIPLFLFVFLSTILLFVFGKNIYHALHNYLSVNEKVEAEVLLIEGWLPYYALLDAKNEFVANNYEYIITSGLTPPDVFNMSENGFLIFFPDIEDIENESPGEHIVEIIGRSELDGENAAFFNVYINDSLMNSFSGKIQESSYTLKWFGKLTDIDSIMIEFVNDALGSFGDRNLYIKEIFIDHYRHFHYMGYTEYDKYVLDGKNRLSNNYASLAELAKNLLVSVGIPSEKVIAIPGSNVKRNRTLKSALAVREYIEEAGLNISGINLITAGIHARRSKMTYVHLLDSSIDIGVYSLFDYQDTFSRKKRLLRLIRECLALFYYRFLLVFY